MPTLVILLVMLGMFVAAMYLFRFLWQRGHSDDFVAAGIPPRPLMAIGLLAGAVAVASGVLFLLLAAQYAPVLKSKPHPTVVVPVPAVTRAAVINQHRVAVVINDSADDAVLPPDLLRRCTDAEITYITPQGDVKCLVEKSPEAKALLHRSPEIVPEDRQEKRPIEAYQQGFLSLASPTEVAQTVSTRVGIDKYAEIFYFVLTFFGVFLRLCWDAVQLPGRTKPALVTTKTIVTSLVLAIAVYAMLIQSGLSGTAGELTFKTSIFALWNGLLSPTLVRDFALLQRQPAVKPVI